MLATFLTAVLHVLLIGSMLAFVVCSLLITIAADNWVERLVRFGALFSGALVVLGSRVGGASFSSFIAESLSSSGLVVATGGVLVPGALGAGLGLFLVRSTYRGNIYVIRVMIFVGMLAATQFAETYVGAIEASGFQLGAPVAPNISFVVGILLCIALTYDPGARDKGRGVLEQIRDPRRTPPQHGSEHPGADPARGF